MKLLKKMIIISLMVIATGKNTQASLSNQSSLLARACSIVPFKTSLGLGLGFIGAAAYCCYKVPQLEAQLDKVKYHDEPVMKKSMVGDAEKDLALLKVVQSKIETMLSSSSKFDDDKKDFFTDLAQELDKLTIATIKGSRPFLTDIAQKRVNEIRKQVASLKDHACDALCKDGCSYAKRLLEEDKHICNILHVLHNGCKKDIAYLNDVKNVQKYKKEHADLVKEHEKEKQRVARLNKSISIARTNLHNAIAWYENLQLPCGIAGASLAFIACISKYFNR